MCRRKGFLSFCQICISQFTRKVGRERGRKKLLVGIWGISEYVHSREKKKKKKFELLVFWVRMFFHFADSSSRTARLSFLQRNAVKWYGKSWWEPVTMMRIPIKWALLGYWAMEFSKMRILYMMAEPWRTSIKTIYVPEGWGFFILDKDFGSLRSGFDNASNP